MSTHNNHRRIVLRNLLATGCALCLPSVGLAELGKISKAQAEYQEQPKNEQKCSNCIHFIAPNSCSIVEGDISQDAWCRLWIKK